ncbi:HNH endonuclease signature motif containing protein [Thauera aromatica]|uniref:HNH endonuclease signature motif containing protein n=1 Tax=Thauera aromatica TaxID=59405 RepID=UPI001FFD5CBD|nr:HNH endonuclease signature motif containing protein [Thauera aromatica]MCK2097250.1 HNH endonuclease [Thauera aromatica]
MTRLNYHRWSADEIATLRLLYPTHPAQQIADQLRLTLKKVYSKAAALGLNKPGDWIAERSRRVMADPNHPSRRTQFKPGMIPHNKGKPHPARGRAAQTQFKKGSVPHTWRPIGTSRVSKEGYLQRKVSDTGVTARDYVAVHHLVWRLHGHTVPAGHALVFRDGDKRNFDINNLELVSRAELMRRNTVHRHGPEVAKAYQLIGAVRRQINRRTRNDIQETTA